MDSRKIDPDLQRAKDFIEWLMLSRCRLNLRNKDGKRAEVVFEMVDWKETSELAAYDGFPRRYPHYRWGFVFKYFRSSHQYGLQRISEMVINSNPVYAYLQKSNSLVDQKSVIAHVYGHADFFLNNSYFANTDRKSIDMIADNAVRIKQFQDEHGVEEVETWIDVCLSVSNLIDINAGAIQRRQCGEDVEDSEEWNGKLPAKDYMDKFINPQSEVEKYRAEEEQKRQREKDIKKKLIIPAEPERDVLAFLIDCAPVEEWQKEIMEIIRNEEYYFVPQAITKIMNEGWAAYWHSKAMTELGLATDAEIVDYADHDAAVTAMPGGKTEINPYYLGREIFRDIEARWDNHRYGEIYEECGERIVLENWEQFVAYRNILEKHKSDDQVNWDGFWAEWKEFLCFWRAFKEGRGLPREIFSNDVLLKYWFLYQTADSSLKDLSTEIEKYKKCLDDGESLRLTEDSLIVSSPEILKDCLAYFERKEKLLRGLSAIRSAFAAGALEPEPFTPPKIFSDYADRFPGSLEIAKGLEKIFEVRKIYCDPTFVDEFLTEDLCARLKLFSFGLPKKDAENYKILSKDFLEVKRILLIRLTNAGRPDVRVEDGNFNNRHELLLKHYYDENELELSGAAGTLRNLHLIWHRPVYLDTILNGKKLLVSFDGKELKHVFEKSEK